LNQGIHRSGKQLTSNGHFQFVKGILESTIDIQYVYLSKHMVQLHSSRFGTVMILYCTIVVVAVVVVVAVAAVEISEISEISE
jgi:hypothetical protein